MSLLDVQNQLVGFFLQKDVLTAGEFSSIKVSEDLTEKKDGVIRAALSLLVDANMIRKVDEDTWILVAPLNSAGQEVHLSMAVCNEIAEIINIDLESKDIEDRVSSLEIHEGHIVALLSIISELLSKDE